MKCRYQNVTVIPYLKYCASSVELAIDWANAIRIVPGFEGHSGQAMPPLCVFVCLCVCVCMCVCGGGEKGQVFC